MRERRCYECGEPLFYDDFLECNKHFKSQYHFCNDLEEMFEEVLTWGVWGKEWLTKIWESEHVELLCCQCYYELHGRREKEC